MNDLIEIKTLMLEDFTMGYLRYMDMMCFTLELPWKDNQRNISCIPAGTYYAKWRTSPTNGQVIELLDVPNRDFIQIHAGNYTSQIQGCILVGDSIKDINGDNIPDVTNSRYTLERLLNQLPDLFLVRISRS